MNARQLLLRMAENNAWANDTLLGACARLTPDEYRATRSNRFFLAADTLARAKDAERAKA